MRGLPILERLSLAYKALVSQFDTGSATYARQMLTGIFPAMKANRLRVSEALRRM